MRAAQHYLVYLVARFAICFVQAIPIEACAMLSRWLGWLLYDVVKLRRRVIDDNLRHAFPELSEQARETIARNTYTHLVLMGCEIAQAPRKIHETNWREHITVKNKREMVNLLLDPRPVVLVSAHYGNFEVSGYILGLLGVPTFSIARTLDNPYLDRYLNRFREIKGQFIVQKDGSAGQLDDLLQRGAKLAFLGDQHAGPKGCWVEFFGRPASCHKAIAVFPLSAAAPLVVSYGRRIPGQPLHFELGMVAELDPADPNTELGGVKPVTQWYNGHLEALIREAPDQYWWVHRRWREPPQKAVKSSPIRAAAA